MIQRLLARVGTAALAAGITLGTAGTANAQHHGGGHAGGHAGGFAGGHAGGFAGGARPVVPGAAFSHRPPVHVNNFHTFVRRGFPVNGFHNPRTTVFLGFGLGGLGYGFYGYPYSYYGGYGYPYYGTYNDSSAYYGPSYDYTTVVVPPTTEALYPLPEQAPAPAPVPALGSARVTVQLPANATLWIDGQPTQQTGATRQFVSPPSLEPGRTYGYTLRAQWVENGQTVTREKTVEFKAGSEVIVNLN
jgi:uncharacterized protein (TIGR03000 family)